MVRLGNYICRISIYVAGVCYRGGVSLIEHLRVRGLM